ncbi:hypothetical protein LX16_0195 [Stackebrandtia albiflava]|uniref:Uncharacterized protein n=1 Tax=Stackebrandtia albiflava TaxID=406432 RepID=A0A562V9G2_9ACTN|nr:hypothetical protein [Stackebrandtia albiflava]TWJ14510.1 hypothetical protein LX16_0195 [Stackebrandtia albiflava]
MTHATTSPAQRCTVDVVSGRVVAGDLPEGARLRPGRLTLDRSAATTGDVYFRRRDGVVELADGLAALVPRASLAELSVTAVLGMCLGARPAPELTHLEKVFRAPPLSVVDVGDEGHLIRCDPHTLSRDGRRRPVRAAVVALGEAVAAGMRENAAVAVAGTASRAVLRLAGPNANRLTAEVDAGGHDDLWPPLPDAQQAVVAALATAAARGVTGVVTGCHLRTLATVDADELAALVGRRHRSVEPWQAHPDVSAEETDHSHDHDTPTADVPPWLTFPGKSRFFAAAAASAAAWKRFLPEDSGRVGRAVWTLTDPAHGRHHDMARALGVELTRPAAAPRAVSALLALTPRQRGAVTAGRIESAALLERLADHPPPQPDGGQRARTAAVAWVNRSHDAVTSFATDGFLARAGLLDRAALIESLSNPFLTARHALTLRRMVAVDRWLSTRPEHA